MTDETTPEAKPALRLLTRDDILKARDLTREQVEVPEWGGSVIIRCLTGAERDAYESDLIVVGKKDGTEGAAEFNLTNLRAKLVARTVVDEDGIRLFDDGDIVALGRKNAAVLDRLFAVAQRLSGLSKKDVDELTTQMGNGLSSASGTV